eukprot:scaffold15670_cov112-Isochrysis_galbana.AAC.10
MKERGVASQVRSPSCWGVFSIVPYTSAGVLVVCVGKSHSRAARCAAVPLLPRAVGPSAPGRARGLN